MTPAELKERAPNQLEARAKIQASIVFSSLDACQAPLQSFVVTQGVCTGVVAGKSVNDAALVNSKSTACAFYFYDTDNCSGGADDYFDLPTDPRCYKLPNFLSANSFKLKC